MGDWEIDIQLPSGAVRGGQGINDYPIVFNTGQVILGWISLYKTTQSERFLASAIRAADWLLAVQDGDGKWQKHTFMNVPHAYHTRVAWSLLEVYRATDREAYRRAAEMNLAWTLGHSRRNGWVDHMAFAPGETPSTHTIAYTLRGLLESAAFLPDPRLLQQVLSASEVLMLLFERRKKNPHAKPEYLPGAFEEGWRFRCGHSCLTGNAQLAVIWLKVYALNEDARFLNAALKLVDQVKVTQRLDDANPGIRGGIAGSYPIWGAYLPYSYPNWAAKFFADALLFQETALARLEDRLA